MFTRIVQLDPVEVKCSGSGKDIETREKVQEKNGSVRKKRKSRKYTGKSDENTGKNVYIPLTHSV